MFRKSVGFFVLVALFWVLLWLYVPDSSANSFTFIDFFRGLFLLFSLMAFGFALLMLIIRYKGIDIASNFIPFSGIVMWLGKHAYQYSQPKTTLVCTYLGTEENFMLTIKTKTQSITVQLTAKLPLAINIGYLDEDPLLLWSDGKGKTQSQTLLIKSQLKKIGKNITVQVALQNNNCQFLWQESTD